MIRIYIAELKKIIDQKKNGQFLKKLLINILKISNLNKKFFRRFVKGEYTINEAAKIFPAYFFNFFKKNLKIKFEFIYRKIVDTDVEKFLKKKIE